MNNIYNKTKNKVSSRTHDQNQYKAHGKKDLMKLEQPNSYELWKTTALQDRTPNQRETTWSRIKVEWDMDKREGKEKLQTKVV